MKTFKKLSRVHDALRKIRDDQTEINCVEGGPCICNDFDLVLDQINDLILKFISSRVRDLKMQYREAKAEAEFYEVYEPNEVLAKRYYDNASKCLLKADRISRKYL